MAEVVDTETAKEFMIETLDKVDVDELGVICGEVEAKSAWFRERLNRDALPNLTHDEFKAILRRVFSTRGKTRPVLEAIEWPRMHGCSCRLP